jgi:hypothetical protein
MLHTLHVWLARACVSTPRDPSNPWKGKVPTVVISPEANRPQRHTLLEIVDIEGACMSWLVRITV